MMNFKEWANTLELEEKEFVEILELFIKTSTSELDQLEAAVEKGDTQQVLRMAHSIKGTASNLGLMDLSEAARTIERIAKENRLKGTVAVVDVIRKDLGRIRDELFATRIASESLVQ